MSSVSLNKSESYDSFLVGWAISDVCLEGHFLDQVAKMMSETLKVITSILGYKDENPHTNSFLQKCDNTQLWKLKYADSTK